MSELGQKRRLTLVPCRLALHPGGLALLVRRALGLPPLLLPCPSALVPGVANAPTNRRETLEAPHGCMSIITDKRAQPPHTLCVWGASSQGPEQGSRLRTAIAPLQGHPHAHPSRGGIRPHHARHWPFGRRPPSPSPYPCPCSPCRPSPCSPPAQGCTTAGRHTEARETASSACWAAPPPLTTC